MKRSEKNELSGIASNNLILKPTTHRNEFTSRVKAHKAITTRVVIGEIPFDLYTSGPKWYEFLATQSPGSEGSLRSSERNELLGKDSDN